MDNLRKETSILIEHGFTQEEAEGLLHDHPVEDVELEKKILRKMSAKKLDFIRRNVTEDKSDGDVTVP